MCTYLLSWDCLHHCNPDRWVHFVRLMARVFLREKSKWKAPFFFSTTFLTSFTFLFFDFYSSNILKTLFFLQFFFIFLLVGFTSKLPNYLHFWLCSTCNCSVTADPYRMKSILQKYAVIEINLFMLLPACVSRSTFLSVPMLMAWFVNWCVELPIYWL